MNNNRDNEGVVGMVARLLAACLAAWPIKPTTVRR